MSRQANKRIAFLGKAPTSRHELHWILQFTDRLVDRRAGESEPMPDNVIPFPGPPRGVRKAPLK